MGQAPNHESSHERVVLLLVVVVVVLVVVVASERFDLLHAHASAAEAPPRTTHVRVKQPPRSLVLASKEVLLSISKSDATRRGEVVHIPTSSFRRNVREYHDHTARMV